MRFVDLFCGIGGFHSALTQLGHECVFACDVDEKAAMTYEMNYGMHAHRDIRDCKNLPNFDILCAGFPCQPFSKSGYQEGFRDQTRGTLFHEIMRIVRESNPSVLFLENVPNLESHDEGNTYQIIKQSIQREGYKFWSRTLSPHMFGTPQIRRRLYMVAVKEEFCRKGDFKFPVGEVGKTSVHSIIDEDKKIDKKYDINQQEIRILDHWNYFIKSFDHGIKIPNPVWSQEFGRNYPLDRIHPITKQWRVTVRDLKRIQENDGIKSRDSRFRKDALEGFPPYIVSAKKPLPGWKKGFIIKNRRFYENYGHLLKNNWLPGVREFKQTYQKLEWQVGNGRKDVWEHMIQFRPSGIRVKRSDYIPALVAIAQIPIIGWKRRRMTPTECARAQDFDVDGIISTPFILHQNDAVAYKQLGNAVNVKLTRIIFEEIEAFMGGLNE